MLSAVVTGASSGLGRDFVEYIAQNHPEIGRIYVIARRSDRLEEIRRSHPEREIIPLVLDLTDEASYIAFSDRLRADSAELELFVSNAGYGKYGAFRDIELREQYGMADLNCRALTAMTQCAIPFMKKGGAIIEVCSIAAFVPTPNMSVYSATKAYVFSLSKSLRRELRPGGINVLAVCPAPMNTEFLSVAGISGKKTSFDMLPRVNPKTIVKNSVERALRGKAVYTCGAMYKLYRVLGKLLPHNWLMKLTTI